MRNLVSTATTFAIAIAGLQFVPQVSAASIAGSVTFDGSLNLDSSFGAATSIVSYTGTLVKPGFQTGDFSTVAGNTASAFTPLTFTPTPTSPFTLWSFNDGTKTYSFDVETVTVEHHDSLFLNLSGTGTAMIDGATPTPATWNLTAVAGAGPTYAFTANIATVPEPNGLTFLVGMLPFGVAFLMRKRPVSQA